MKDECSCLRCENFQAEDCPYEHELIQKTRLHAELEAANAEVEQLRVQLAGCGVAALGGTSEPANEGDYGWSPAYQDVLSLRQELEAAKTEREKYRCDARRMQTELNRLAEFIDAADPPANPVDAARESFLRGASEIIELSEENERLKERLKKAIPIIRNANRPPNSGEAWDLHKWLTDWLNASAEFLAECEKEEKKNG